MAKVEQFPEETGKKDRTEDDNFIEEQERAERPGSFFDPEEEQSGGSFFDGEWPETAGRPESVLSFFDIEEPETAQEPEAILSFFDFEEPKTERARDAAETSVFDKKKERGASNDILPAGSGSGHDNDEGAKKPDGAGEGKSGGSLPAEKESGEDSGSGAGKPGGSPAAGNGGEDSGGGEKPDSSPAAGEENAEDSGGGEGKTQDSLSAEKGGGPETAGASSKEYDGPAEGTEHDRVAAGRPEKVDVSLLTGKKPEDADAPDSSRAAGGLLMSGSEDAAGVAKAVSQVYEDRIRRHRERVRYIRILSAAAVLVVIALVALYFSSRHYNRAEITKVRDFVAEEGSSCVSLGGCILQYGPNGATCAGTDGRVRWSITYEMDQPIISVSDKTAAIADYGGRTIYVMNTRKQLCTITTSLPIHKVSASDSGEVAAVLDDRKATWIRLYSDQGKEIAYFTRSVEENGYPMDVAVSPDGKKVCISSLKLQDSSAVSSLSFYDFGKAGQKYDQFMVGSFEYENEVFPYVRFMGNGACCAASDSRLVVIDTRSTEPKNSFNNMLTEDLQGVFKSGGRIALVFMDLTRENLYRLDLYGRSGKKEGSIGFSMPFKNIQIKGNRIYINNEQSMQIYTLSGKQIFDGGFDRAVKVLIPRWSGRITAVSVNEIDEVKLR